MTLQKRSAMIIDDSPTVRFMLKKHFADLGYDILGVAQDSDTTMKILENLKQTGASPEVITVDLVIPGVEGSELIKQIKDLHPTSKIAVITAFESQEAKREYKDLTPDFFFQKPIQKQHLEMICVSAV